MHSGIIQHVSASKLNLSTGIAYSVKWLSLDWLQKKEQQEIRSVVAPEAGQLGLVPTQPLSQLGLGSTRPGQLGLFSFLMVNRDITYETNKKFGRYDLEYAR